MARILMVAPEDVLLRALRASPLLEGHSVETATGSFDALRRVSRHGCDVLLSAPTTSLEEDLALLELLRSARPGIRVLLLAPRTTPEEVIAALRSRVFAVFSAPFEAPAIADMVARALSGEAREGIEVVSARPDWITLRVNCRLLDAERLVNFLTELRSDVPDEPRDQLMLAFREVLLNAMEHGGGFDPQQVVEVSAVRTRRSLVFYVRDPGAGFDLEDVPHAAVSNPPGDPLGHASVRAAAGLRPGGFGLLLARQVVDEMIHSERANEVLLIKHLS
ncbi:MAG TPA: ATP-binding protein [Vicinamibacteria bacterium]|nr:ATP-binding protein [Vicinamibacteria bacterium]